MNVKMFTTSSLLIAIILLLAVNIFSNTVFTSARIDLTDGKLYTLTKGTENILSGLKEPITLRFYLSQKLATRSPGIAGYATRVRELLEEYARQANGEINLTLIDPEPFSEAEDEAVGLGLKGVPIDDSGNNFYFGLVARGATDEEAVIPFFTPQRQEFVEYDVTKIIQQVANPKKKVVGLITALNIDGAPEQPHMPGMGTMPRPGTPWVVYEQMTQFFDIKKLDPDVDVIPENIDVLMLVHPKDIAIETQYAIDQFVLKGGRVLAFVDPHAETDQVSQQAQGLPGNTFGESYLDPLLKSWGVKITHGKVVADMQLAQKVAFNMGQRSAAIDYPVWIKITDEQLNKDDIVTADLGMMVIASPGGLESLNTEGINVTPLIHTTDNATRLDKSSLGFMMDPQDILRNYKPSGTSFNIAARITGKAKSAFPDGKPKQEPANGEATDDKKSDSSATGEHLAESTSDINVIVVADTDLLDDRFWVRAQNLFGTRLTIPTASNGSFVINALDNLMGSNDLISVRNRGHFTRPFTRVDEIRQEAELAFREKEQQLMNQLRETERKLVELQRGKDDQSSMILSPEQQAALERFRQDKIKIRKELRKVRHELNKNIESLESLTKFINIGIIPILVGLVGIFIAVMRARKRKITEQTAAGLT